MKPEELKDIYKSTPAFHASVLSAFDKLDEQAPRLYKKRKGALKIALVCMNKIIAHYELRIDMVTHRNVS